MSDVNFMCRTPKFHPCVPSGQYIGLGSKNVVDNFLAISSKKNLFVHVCTASNNLKDILS